MIRMKWSMGVIGTAASIAIGLAGQAQGRQSASTQPPPPAAPAAPAAPAQAAAPSAPSVRALTLTSKGADAGNTGKWLFRTGDDQITIETQDGKVTRAERNGKEIPADRVSIDGGAIKITDENGKIIFEMAAPTTATPSVYTWSQRVNGARPWTAQAVPAEPPKVMLGITMAEPEYGLKKHCGVDTDTGTMVNEVYKDLPAAKAGIEPYDVIIEVDGKSPATQDVVREVLRTKNAGDEIKLTLLHRCEKKQAAVKLEAYDPKRLEAARQEQMRQLGVVTGQDADPDAATLFGKLRGQNGQDMFIAVDPAARDQFMRELQERMDEINTKTDSMRLYSNDLSRKLAERRELTDDRMKALEDRLGRLEKMLEQLVEQKTAAPKQ